MNEDMLLGFACGVAACIGIALIWAATRLRRRALPPATRRQLDRAARRNRPQLRIVGSNQTMPSVDELDHEDTHQ